MNIRKIKKIAVQKFNRKMKVITAVAVVLVISVSSLVSRGSEEEIEEVTKVDVDVATPVINEIHLTGNFVGTIETDGKVAVTPRISGQVTNKYYSVGDYVNAGDVLFTLDDREFQIEKTVAEANIRSNQAALEAQKARNQETVASANETIHTMDTKTNELNNSVISSAREEESSRAKRDEAASSRKVYESETGSISNQISEANSRVASAKEFTAHLNTIKDTYQQIVSEKGEADAIEYLKTNSEYESLEQLETAISTAVEAEKAAETEKKELDSSYSANLVSKMEAELNERVENGNIASAQEAKALAQRMKSDYENFTKVTQMADVQAKLAEGNAAVVSADAATITAMTELQTANLKIEYSTVTAPISGIIQEIHINQYETASDQAVAYVISNPSQEKVVFYVTDEVRKNIEIGQKVTLKKDETEYTAFVDYVGNTVDDEKKLFKVSAYLNEGAKEQFSIGSNVSLSTSIRTEKTAFSIPIGAVYYSEGKPYVYVAKDGKAVKTDIETGISDSENIQVISGLSANDQVIVTWSAQLKDQAEVAIKNQAVKEADKDKVKNKEENKIETTKSKEEATKEDTKNE